MTLTAAMPEDTGHKPRPKGKPQSAGGIKKPEIDIAVTRKPRSGMMTYGIVTVNGRVLYYEVQINSPSFASVTLLTREGKCLAHQLRCRISFSGKPFPYLKIPLSFRFS